MAFLEYYTPTTIRRALFIVGLLFMLSFKRHNIIVILSKPIWRVMRKTLFNGLCFIRWMPFLLILFLCNLQ